MSTKIFLSAGSEESKTLSSVNPPYVLCSYWPLFKKGANTTREILDRYPKDTKIMVDSGAHAFRQDRPEFGNKKFYDNKRPLLDEPALTRTRLLAPGDPKSPKKVFYNPNILKIFDEHYARK